MLKKSLWATFAIICYSFQLGAQVADTIRVEFNQQTQLQYIFDNPEDFRVFENANIDSITKVLSKRVSSFDASVDTTLILGDSCKKAYETSGSNLFIEITPKLGANLVRSTLVPDYGVRIGIGSDGLFDNNDKGPYAKKWKNTYFLEYQHLLFFTPEGTNGFNQFGNGFVNFGYTREVKDNEFSLSLGYLVKQSGPYFGANTTKLDFNIPIQKNLSVSPFLIGTNNFNSFIPGIRLSVLY